MRGNSSQSTAELPVVIVGAGFSGTLTALNLARLSTRALRVVLLHQGPFLGCGVAYGTRSLEHLLNVAARNMSAFPDQPDHFVNWLRTRSEYDREETISLRERFIPRSHYADYLRSLLQHRLTPMDSQSLVKLEVVEDEAVDIEPVEQGLSLRMRSGQNLDAGSVVLATGNEPPMSLPGDEKLQGHPAWLSNPWQSIGRHLPADGGTIILIGTGLTTIDAIVSLLRSDWRGKIVAVSRHGLLPHSHFRGIEYPDFPPPGVELPKLGLDRLVRLIEHHCGLLRERFANPAIVIDKMRPHTQRVWKAFSVDEKHRFVREHSTHWNVMRHRIAPEIHRAVAEAIQNGRVQIMAATIESVAAEGGGVRVHLSQENTQLPKSLLGDLVVNATGPTTRFTATRSTLLQNLLRRGLIEADEMDMGIRVAENHTILSDSIEPPSRLLAVGPLLRGTLWETIAVPELRVQAKLVAQTILEQQSAVEESVSADMLEYMI